MILIKRIKREGGDPQQNLPELNSAQTFLRALLLPLCAQHGALGLLLLLSSAAQRGSGQCDFAPLAELPAHSEGRERSGAAILPGLLLQIPAAKWFKSH